MSQSRYGTLVSLILLLGLTAGFFFAARIAIKAVSNSVEKAIATATVIVLPPTPTVLVSPTKVKPTHPHVTTEPTETPTPNAAGQIVVSTSSSLSGATSSFPASTSRYWCVANLPSTPLGTGITWKWLHVIANTAEEIWTSTPYTYNSPVRYGYIDGPFAVGQYRCQVLAGGQVLGAADFSVK